MKRFQNSFKCQNREESDIFIVCDDRKHWEGTESSLKGERQTETKETLQNGKQLQNQAINHHMQTWRF